MDEKTQLHSRQATTANKPASTVPPLTRVVATPLLPLPCAAPVCVVEEVLDVELDELLLTVLFALEEPDVAVADDEEPAGATAATFATFVHAAWAFVASSPSLYDRNISAPVLSSWTSEVMLAA
ncbi:hypothetical protein A0H81_02337 [Grifola frondosa]|uniref:Uncharacterized protein n=1 Tax=Grifola frondosa TaxID=5627 RepID=A0A1C7MLU2_GRIFR|nr:hypothetical protein A0H81_02337 [Grifola frondosa]